MESTKTTFEFSKFGKLFSSSSKELFSVYKFNIRQFKGQLKI